MEERFTTRCHSQVTWMDVCITTNVVWTRLSRNARDYFRAFRTACRSVLCVDKSFAISLTHVSTLQVMNTSALNHLFCDGRFDDGLEALFLVEHKDATRGAISRAREANDALQHLAREVKKEGDVKLFSDFFKCQELSSRCSPLY